ncbi:MAG: DNA polymerase III subunit gamma/tau, partial [Deltaproteobacteria bacterium]
IALGNSVDVAEIDGASNNGVDDVRAIRENARYLPSRDRHKIYIIDEVHMLSQAAFNALLKTLEEPPPHVKFIFATTEAHKVPDTIVSRCQLHTFRRIPLGQLVARLREVSTAEGFGLGDEALALLARQAEGGLRDALSMLDQVVSSCGPSPTPEAVAEALGAVDRRSVVELARALCERDAARLVRLLGELNARGHEPRRICETLCEELRHLVVCRATGAPPAELPDHEQREVAELAKAAELPQLARLFDLAHGALAELGRSFEPRLALEVALLKGVFLAPGTSIGELLARVETLAAQAGGAPPQAGGGGLQARREAPASPPGPPTPKGPQRQSPGPAAAPAAAKPPADRGRPAAQDDMMLPAAERLARLCEVLSAESPRLGTALRNGRLQALERGRLTLAFPPGDFRASLLAGERAGVEAVLASFFGAPTRLELTEAADGTGEASVAEREAQGQKAHGDRVRSEALQSEAVKETLRLLGGEVEEIRVLSEGPGRK